ncbi:MAG: hypothetical protein ACT4QD_15730 [Acidobacteriota bacterium]
MKKVRFIGLDVHADTIAAAVAEPSGEERSMGVIPNRPESIRKLVKKPGPSEQLRVCYEAGGDRLFALHCDARKTSASMAASLRANSKAATMAAEGAHGKENPRAAYAVGFRAEPALLVRGSSRRITIMRFRPANIRVINRRDRRLDRLRCCLRDLSRSFEIELT